LKLSLTLGLDLDLGGDIETFLVFIVEGLEKPPLTPPLIY